MVWRRRLVLQQTSEQKQFTAPANWNRTRSTSVFGFATIDITMLSVLVHSHYLRVLQYLLFAVDFFCTRIGIRCHDTVSHCNNGLKCSRSIVTRLRHDALCFCTDPCPDLSGSMHLASCRSLQRRGYWTVDSEKAQKHCPLIAHSARNLRGLCLRPRH
jgi:hypothetical protein